MSIQIERLENGLTIITELMPGLASAALGIWINAGSRHESAAQNGVAHFLEHMAFKGTNTRSAFDISKEIENVGGFINAYTSRDTTAYYVRMLKEDVPLGLDILSDILQNPLFAEKDIAVERDVILQEIGMCRDTPDDIIFDWLQERAYPDQSMGRSILGPPEIVQAMDAETLRQFVAAQYSPQNMVVCAVGAVDHQSICAQMRGLWESKETRTAQAADPAQFVGGETRQEKSLEQAHFALSFESPNIHDDHLYTAQIFNVALGGGMSSRLFQEIREKRGLCYSIYSHLITHQDTGNTIIYSGTSQEGIADLGKAVVDVIDQTAQSFSQEELNRARAQMKAGLLMGLEGPSSRAERMARQMHIFGEVIPLEKTVARIDSVDVDQVRAFATNMLQSAPAAQALYGPIAAAPSLADIGVQERA